MSKWWEHASPGGPMVGPSFIRPLYPPDAAKKGRVPSPDGDDILAVKRGVWRSGHWPGPASNFDRAFSNAFSHGRGPNVSENGLAGLQRQNNVDATGWMGEKTFNLIRSARISDGLPGAGEPILDATAIDLLERFAKQYANTDWRQRSMQHMEARVGYTEQPANSNCDNREDGIRAAQDATAGGEAWLRYQPWCGCWCYYALETAEVQGIDSHLASVAAIEDYAKQGAKCYRGWTTDRSKIKKGDLVVIGGYGVHVEMVRGPAQSDSGIPTYGGNTSPGNSGSQSNGGGAYKRVRYPSEVRGFALVRFPQE
jgi:hypothetical protein